MERITASLASEPASGARARAALEPLRASLRPAEFEDLRIVVSELVADVVLNTDESHGDMDLAVEVTDGTTCVEVEEGAAAFRLISIHPEPGEAGFGLQLAQRVADRWSLRRAGSKTAVRIEMYAPVAAETG